MDTDRSLLVKSRTGFLSHRDCMDEEYEYANKLVKQGVKHPRKVPKFTIIHERFNTDAHAIRANLLRFSDIPNTATKNAKD